jgi:hypothetical protein
VALVIFKNCMLPGGYKIIGAPRNIWDKNPATPLNVMCHLVEKLGKIKVWLC